MVGEAGYADERDNLGRRSLIATLLAFAGATVLVVGVATVVGLEHARSDSDSDPDRSSDAAASQQRTAPALDPATRAWFARYADGHSFAGWAIRELEATHDGALRVVLADDSGARVTVDLRPLDPESPPPIARSETLAVYVHGRELPPSAHTASEALAAVLRELERAGPLPIELEPLTDDRP